MAAAMARREAVYEAIALAIWETPVLELGPAQVEEAYRIADRVMAAVLVADNQTDDGASTAVLPQAAVPPSAPSSLHPLTDDEAAGELAVDGLLLRPETSEVAAGPASSSPFPRRFQLFRHRDVSGKSGTGVVAEGVEFTDGSCALRWRGDWAATAVWPSIEAIVAIHGHEGATEIRWIDPEPHVGYWPVEEHPE